MYKINVPNNLRNKLLFNDQIIVLIQMSFTYESVFSIALMVIHTAFYTVSNAMLDSAGIVWLAGLPMFVANVVKWLTQYCNPLAYVEKVMNSNPIIT